jgi:argininosuccinate synthase
LYDEKFSSMDEMGGFEPEETSGFISVSAIRLKAWAEAKYVSTASSTVPTLTPFSCSIRKGQGGVKPADVYGTRL